MNILERRKADIFSIFVFNNLKQLSPIFHPFFFLTLATAESAKYINFNNIDFCKIFAIRC